MVNAQDADVINMKKIIFLIILFLIYTIIVRYCPVVTQWDENVIVFLQENLKNVPLTLPTLFDSKLYSMSIIVPLIIGVILFFRKMLIIDVILFCSAPLNAYILNSVIKNIVQRPRPPIELQIAVQPHSFYSYVSNHTFITASLWGLIIFYIIKYCQNNILKYALVIFSILWILLAGFSRIWLGVHNPTDVLGGYFLAGILLYGYINAINIIGGKA